MRSQKEPPCALTLHTRDGRISDLTIRIRPDFPLSCEISLRPHYVFPAGSDRDERLRSDSRTICRYRMSIVWLTSSRQSVLDPADQWSALSFHVSRSRVYPVDAEESVDKHYWSVTVCGMVYKASSPSNSVGRRRNHWSVTGSEAAVEERALAFGLLPVSSA